MSDSGAESAAKTESICKKEENSALLKTNGLTSENWRWLGKGISLRKTKYSHCWKKKKKKQNTTTNKQHIHKKTLRLLSSQRESVSLWLEEKGQWEGLPQISPKLKDCGGGLEGVEDCVTSGDTFVQSALAFPSWRICFWKKG